MIWTSQYRYSGRDRLDITVAGRCPVGKMWAPTWEMVNSFKAGTLTQEQYSKMYYDLLLKRWHEISDFPDVTLRLVEMVKDRDITLVCFCPAGSFCHRHLMVRWLQYNWNVLYGGERKVK